MAISPTEALGNKTLIFHLAVREFENKCDDALRIVYTGSAITVSASGFSESVRAEVKKRFEAQGWIVSVHDSCLTFNAKPKPREMTAEDYYNK